MDYNVTRYRITGEQFIFYYSSNNYLSIQKSTYTWKGWSNRRVYICIHNDIILFRNTLKYTAEVLFKYYET
jgi:hypothetical protein